MGCDTSNLTGGDEKYAWPIWLDNTGGANEEGKPVVMNPGDMLVYRGCDIEHWREPFLGNNHAQVFLHFNDKQGPLGDNCQFDARPSLGLPGEFKSRRKLDAMEIAMKQYDEEKRKD